MKIGFSKSNLIEAVDWHATTAAKHGTFETKDFTREKKFDISDRVIKAASSVRKPGYALAGHVGGSYEHIDRRINKSYQVIIDRAADCLRRAKLSRSLRALIE